MHKALSQAAYLHIRRSLAVVGLGEGGECKGLGRVFGGLGPKFSWEG